MIILDTNVLSELVKPAPAASVVQWLIAQRFARNLFVTSVTEAEIFYGIALLPKGKRRGTFMDAANIMFEQDFLDRVLPFDQSAARAYAELAAQRRRMGRPIAPFDGQIAAIALSREASIATRNIADFAHLGLEIVDPWTATIH